MSDLPTHPEEVEQAEARERAESIRHMYGYVDKSGDVSIHIVKPPAKGPIGPQRGDSPLLWLNGAVQVVERHQKLGGRLLRDICIADGCPEKYDRWLKAVSLRGKVEIRNVEDLYPPTVHRLRRENASGVSLDMVFDAATGELVKSTDSSKAARVAELLDGAGVGKPTAEDRKAAKA